MGINPEEEEDEEEVLTYPNHSTASRDIYSCRTPASPISTQSRAP